MPAFLAWPAIKLFFGGLVRKLVQWLSHRSFWQLVCMALAVYCGLQFLELSRARAEAAKWHHQFDAEHSGRIADRKTYKQAQADAAALNKVHVQQIETKQQKVTTDVETDYQRKLAALRSGLRAQPPAAQGSANGAGSSKVPDASSGPDAEAGVPLPDSERLRAAENELQLDELITWIEQQTKIDPNAITH